MISNWKKDGYSDTICYLALNVKSCPQCTVRIENDGGCNYMVSDCMLLFLFFSVIVCCGSNDNIDIEFDSRNANCVNMNFVVYAMANGITQKCMTFAQLVTNAQMMVPKMWKGKIDQKMNRIGFIEFVLKKFRYQHYLMYYTMNEISLECEKKLMDSDKINGRIQKLMDNGVSISNVSWIKWLNFAERIIIYYFVGLLCCSHISWRKR